LSVDSQYILLFNANVHPKVKIELLAGIAISYGYTYTLYSAGSYTI